MSCNTENYNPNLYLHTENPDGQTVIQLNISVWDFVSTETIVCTANFQMLSINM